MASCHSKFSNQFCWSELHGGLVEEHGLMCRVVVILKINTIQYYPVRYVSHLIMIAGALRNFPCGIVGSLDVNTSSLSIIGDSGRATSAAKVNSEPDM